MNGPALKRRRHRPRRERGGYVTVLTYCLASDGKHECPGRTGQQMRRRVRCVTCGGLPCCRPVLLLAIHLPVIAWCVVARRLWVGQAFVLTDACVAGPLGGRRRLHVPWPRRRRCGRHVALGHVAAWVCTVGGSVRVSPRRLQQGDMRQAGWTKESVPYSNGTQSEARRFIEHNILCLWAWRLRLLGGFELVGNSVKPPLAQASMAE